MIICLRALYGYCTCALNVHLGDFLYGKHKKEYGGNVGEKPRWRGKYVHLRIRKQVTAIVEKYRRTVNHSECLCSSIFPYKEKSDTNDGKDALGSLYRKIQQNPLTEYSLFRLSITHSWAWRTFSTGLSQYRSLFGGHRALPDEPIPQNEHSWRFAYTYDPFFFSENLFLFPPCD